MKGLMATPYGVVRSSGACSYALRVACGDKVVAYSGDTGCTDALIPIAQGADHFVCECYPPTTSNL
jgi:ribonuclease BN (tRNA processing enzyme)